MVELGQSDDVGGVSVDGPLGEIAEGEELDEFLA